MFIALEVCTSSQNVILVNHIIGTLFVKSISAGDRNTYTVSPVDYEVTESEDIGESVVILTETDQELQLNPVEQVEREALSFLESFPLFSTSSTEKNLVTPNTTESTQNATSEPDFIHIFNITSPPAETNETQHPLNITSYETEFENTTGLPDVYQNQTTNTEESTPFADDEDSLQSNVTAADDSYEENITNTTEETNTTSVPALHVKLEEVVVNEPLEITLLTESPEEDDISTQPTRAFQSPTEELPSWLSLDGSGDDSQGKTAPLHNNKGHAQSTQLLDLPYITHSLKCNMCNKTPLVFFVLF